MASTRQLDPDSNMFDWAAVELRRRMYLKSVTNRQVARIINKHPSLITKIERGETPMQPAHAAALDEAWPETAGLFSRIVGFARSRHSDEWVEESEALLKKAAKVELWSLGWIPALFRTPEYAAAVFGVARGVDVEAAVRHRQGLQAAVLEGNRRPVIRAFIDQGALELPVGDRGVHARQLDRLIDMCEAGYTIRVVPPDAGAHIGRDGSFSIYTGADGRAHPYAYSVGTGRLIKDSAAIPMFTDGMDAIGDEALRASESLAVLRHIREQIE